MTIKKGFLLASLLIFTGSALAAEPYKQIGVYIGANAGWSKWDDDNQLPDHKGIDDNDITWQINAGYKFNRYFAVDARYMDLGKYDVVGTDVNFRAWSANAIGILPLSSNWELFGEVGAGRIRDKKESSLDETQYNLGGGIRWAINRHLSLSAQANMYRFKIRELDDSHNHIYTFTGGIQYLFE